jgi:hypothetical protein
MPVWGTVLLAVLGGWLVLSVVVALAVGRAIRIADRRSPRKPDARARRRRRRSLHAVERSEDVAESGDRRRQPGG